MSISTPSGPNDDDQTPADVGEDEGGTSKEGKDDHLKEDQKPLGSPASAS